MATTALHALWDFLFDPGFIESSFETRPSFLRSLTTEDAFRRALHDFFAFVCLGDDSCDVRFIHKGQVLRMQTPPASWGKLIGVRPAPYVPIELEEADELETDNGLCDNA